MVQPVGQTDAGQKLFGTARHFGTGTRQFRRKQDVLFGGQGRNQLKGLKYKSDLAPAHFRHPVFREAGDVLAIEQNLAAGGVVESGEQTQQGTLSASRGPHNCNEFTARDAQIDSPQDFDPVRGRFDCAGQADDFNDGCHVCHDYGSVP